MTVESESPIHTHHADVWKRHGPSQEKCVQSLSSFNEQVHEHFLQGPAHDHDLGEGKRE